MNGSAILFSPSAAQQQQLSFIPMHFSFQNQCESVASRINLDIKPRRMLHCNLCDDEFLGLLRSGDLPSQEIRSPIKNRLRHHPHSNSDLGQQYFEGGSYACKRVIHRMTRHCAVLLCIVSCLFGVAVLNRILVRSLLLLLLILNVIKTIQHFPAFSLPFDLNYPSFKVRRRVGTFSWGWSGLAVFFKLSWRRRCCCCCCCINFNNGQVLDSFK